MGQAGCLLSPQHDISGPNSETGWLRHTRHRQVSETPSSTTLIVSCGVVAWRYLGPARCVLPTEHDLSGTSIEKCRVRDTCHWEVS